MTDTLRNMPRYIRNTDAFGWQGADDSNGPWRSINPPQSGTPWQTTSTTNDLRQASAEVSGVDVLSPAAQAVLDAFRAVPDLRDCPSIAAALRAVVEHLSETHAGFDLADRYGRFVEADDILAIATELEGAND